MRIPVAFVLALTFGVGCVRYVHVDTVADKSTTAQICKERSDGTMLQDGTLFISPGDTVCLEVQPRGGDLTLVGLTEALGSTTISIRTEVRSTFVSVFIRNPFNQNLNYRTGIQRPGNSEFVVVVSCTVGAGLGNHVTMPPPVQALSFTDFRFLGKGEEMSCN